MEQIGLVEIAGIAIVLGCGAWVVAFFQLIRPRVMRRVGRRLEVGVHESIGVIDAGDYRADTSAPAATRAAVAIADFVVLMAAVPGVLSLVSIAAFLVADSGAPWRWEGALTGAAARIGDVVVAEMRDGRSTATVAVRNAGREPASSCRLAVADYRARDGYLTGGSAFFDLAPGEARRIDLPLQAARVIPGVHTFRISFECRHRLKDRGTATIRITR
jgi:hypothetical protein